MVCCLFGFVQIPPDEGSTAPPAVEVLSSPPVLESSSVSLPADWTPVITQTVPEQVTEVGGQEFITHLRQEKLSSSKLKKGLSPLFPDHS